MTPLTRRHFITLSSAVAATALLPRDLFAASSGTAWPVGCFNRPWTKWSYDRTEPTGDGANGVWPLFVISRLKRS